MNYKDKFSGEVIQAVQVQDSIKSVKEVLEFTGKDVPNELSPEFYVYCSALNIGEGIAIEPYKVAHIGDYIAKYRGISFRVFKEDEFKKYYKPADNIGDMTIQLNLDTHEYDALLTEAKQTADRLQGIVNKLRNYRIDTIQSNDRLHCTCVLKPGE